MTEQACAFVAVVGAPNAGKSSLVNALVGAKVSIVTQKAQTTRMRVRGVAIEGDAQLVFIDTPGVFAPRRRLDRAMVAAAFGALEGADAVLLVVDAADFAAKAERRPRSVADALGLVAALKGRGVTATLVVNKIDSVARPSLLAVVAELSAAGAFSETFLVSAKTGDGLKDLKARLVAAAPNGPWMYPEDQLSDISERLMAAETTREKLYLRLHQELPYEATVETDVFTRTKKGELRIEQTIYVAREGQKPIVLGKGGATLKAIGEAARLELAELLGEPVHLFLHVKVKENWAEDPARFRALGLEWGR